MKKISILIPVYNRKKCVQNVLAQLQEQIAETCSFGHIFVVVIDDGSTDGTKELIQNKFTFVHLLEGDGFLWWTGAMVKGMQYAIEVLDTDYVVWLNDDVSIAKDFIANLIKVCHSEKYQGMIVGGIVRDLTYPDWIVYSGIRKGKQINKITDFSDSQELEVGDLNGNIVIIPHFIIDKIGLPDRIKFPHNGSDFEYIRRAKKKGFKIISSSRIQGFTDYQITDVIRYMPYWMQWYLQPNISKRLQIIKNLRNLKTTENIYFAVNVCNPNKNISRWRYELCYIKKIIKIFAINFMPRSYQEAKLYKYLNFRGTPTNLTNALIGAFKEDKKAL